MANTIAVSIEIIIGAAVFAVNMLVLGPIGYIFRAHLIDYREFKKAIDAKAEMIDDSIGLLKQELPDKYMSIKRHTKELDELKSLLLKILEKLDSKADR